MVHGCTRVNRVIALASVRFCFVYYQSRWYRHRVWDFRHETNVCLPVTARRWPERTDGDPTVRRLRRSNSREMAVVRDGSVLAQRMPKVLLLQRSVGGNRSFLLHKERNDPLQNRLQKVSATSFVRAQFANGLHKLSNNYNTELVIREK